MSRRDTIIVAVLVNTGLLAVLFMMAVQPNLETPAAPQEKFSHRISSHAPLSLPASVKKVETVAYKDSNPRDEIDQVLEKYSAQASAPIEVTAQRQDNPNELTLPPSKDLLSAEKPRHVEVTVKRGDYLEKIAKANGTTVSAIRKVNHLQSSRIDVGQVLLVPIGTSLTAAQNKTSSVREPEYYTMKKGDNPWKIAKQYRVGFGELLLMNDLDENKARNLKPGDVLRVR